MPLTSTYASVHTPHATCCFIFPSSYQLIKPFTASPTFLHWDNLSSTLPQYLELAFKLMTNASVYSPYKYSLILFIIAFLLFFTKEITQRKNKYITHYPQLWWRENSSTRLPLHSLFIYLSTLIYCLLIHSYICLLFHSFIYKIFFLTLIFLLCDIIICLAKASSNCITGNHTLTPFIKTSPTHNTSFSHHFVCTTSSSHFPATLYSYCDVFLSWQSIQ